MPCFSLANVNIAIYHYVASIIPRTFRCGARMFSTTHVSIMARGNSHTEALGVKFIAIVAKTCTKKKKKTLS